MIMPKEIKTPDIEKGNNPLNALIPLLIKFAEDISKMPPIDYEKLFPKK